ncbi:hypothetical protein [Methylobacterium oryzisoli]|uniref:hypothetical protein n=1 Tax=Methylobacterium oryzisoli TaxID=3385502 RepID=UPI00389192F0
MVISVRAALAAAAFLLPAAALAQQPGEPAPRGIPADLCRELVAFVRPPAPPQPAAPPPQQAVAVQAPQGGQAQLPSAGAGETQQKSGLSGPVAQTGPGAPGPQGQAQAAAPSGAAAPPAAGKPTPAMIEQVDAAAATRDVKACRAAARQMRAAGVVMPAPLLALAALDPKFFPPAQ